MTGAERNSCIQSGMGGRASSCAAVASSMGAGSSKKEKSSSASVTTNTLEGGSAGVEVEMGELGLSKSINQSGKSSPSLLLATKAFTSIPTGLPITAGVDGLGVSQLSKKSKSSWAAGGAGVAGGVLRWSKGSCSWERVASSSSLIKRLLA